MSSKNYSYVSSGYDAFLSRSIDDVAQVNLDSTGPTSTAIRYDSAQISGMLGDVLPIGNILIDGVTGRISVFDSTGKEMTRLGNLDG